MAIGGHLEYQFAKSLDSCYADTEALVVSFPKNVFGQPKSTAIIWSTFSGGSMNHK